MEPTVESLARLVATANDLRLEGVISRREWAKNLKIIFDRADRMGITESQIEAAIMKRAM